MNKSLLVLLLVPFFIISINAQSTGDYRTFQSGTWSNLSTWERFDGTIWVNPAPSAPSFSDGVIDVLAGDSVSIDVPVTADQLIIENSAFVKVETGITFTVNDGFDTVDVVINGTFKMTGLVTATGVISVENNGLFIFNSSSTSMPVIRWRTGSTCSIQSVSTPTNLKTQALYNLEYNAPDMGANGGPNFDDGYVLSGNLTILNTKSLQMRLANLSGGQTKNIYILGNVTVNGSTAFLTSTGSGADTLAKAVINVNGNVNVMAGTLSLVNSSAAYAEWKIKGNLNISGGTLQSGASGTAIRRVVNFNSGGAQSFSITSPGILGTASTIFKVSGGSVVTLNSPITLMANGRLNLESGKFVTTATNLLSLPASASIMGGSSASYVDGPLAAALATTNTTAMNFPVGKNTTYRPVVLTMSQDAATPTTYQVEVNNEAPASRILPPTLDSVSSVRYYKITKGTGANISSTLGATIQLSYGADDNVPVDSVIRVVLDDGAGNWLNKGGSGTAGTITSNAFYALGDFVLGYSAGGLVNPPTVSTAAITFISTTFATSGGNVTADGGGPVTAKGVCWKTSPGATTSDFLTTDGAGNGIFTSSITSLIPGTIYYLRAYATNSAGTAYGDEIIFTTLSSVATPTVVTTAITNILVTSANGGGNVTAWGGAEVTGRGICWNTTGSPTLANSFTEDGAGLGPFISGLSPLTGATQYYVRAYANNSAGTGYGDEVTFTTATPLSDTMIIVAKDGTGNYTTVQEAFRNVPLNYTGKWKIFVKNGVYYEKDTLAAGKINVILQGENRDSTIITYDDYADRIAPGVPGTSGSFTIAIDASDFIAKDITFRNTYSPQPGVTGTQAVALRTQGDRHEYYNCNILGYQDTYYTWGGNGVGRMYHKNCFIEGTVDFIFGRNIAVFDSCTIHEIRNAGTLTAGATDVTSKFGYVFRNCLITADSIGYDGNPITTYYFGRPWQGSPRTVFTNCYEQGNLSPAGWLSWNVTPALYAEFRCTGPASSTTSRVPWSVQLTDSVAASYYLANIFAKSSAVSPLILYNWIPSDTAHFRVALTPPTAFQLSVAVTDGWNIVSAPGLHPLDQGVNTWWPFRELAAGVYQYNGTYQEVTTTTPGKGYWMYNTDIRTYNTGEEWPASGINIVPNTPIPAEAGWNLIGCYNYNVPVSGLTTSSGTILSSVFGYTSGYHAVTELVPGYGYWINISQAANIILPDQGLRGAANTIAKIDDSWGKIILSDNAGKSYTLYSAPEGVALNQYDLPPAPPAGIMDVRYSSQRYVENISKGSQGIDFKGMEYPVTIRVENLSVTLQDVTAKLINIKLKPGEKISISSSEINKVVISGDVIPGKYFLNQNYPNPFNPGTMIEFSLPEDVTNVTLTIYDALGQKVAELLKDSMKAGYHQYQWNAQNFSSGVYIYRLSTEKFTSTRKMMLIK